MYRSPDEVTSWAWSHGSGQKLTMTLDGVELRFHVRERDNRVAVVVSQPGWAAKTGNDYWYVSVEDLRDTGKTSEGQRVSAWQHREGSTHPGGVTYAEAVTVARRLYEREALTPGT